MARRPCIRCGVLIERGSYCPRHQPVGWVERPSPSSRDRPSQRLIARVRERDGHACQRCGATERLQVHHVRGVARGGKHEASNLIVLCADCHRAAERGGGASPDS